jgi:ketosteroid isomerase-like protein
MKPEDFVEAYEGALGTQSWDAVEPLIHENACVTFSTGAVHKGKSQVQKAFEKNFSSIESEKYSISNVFWVTRGTDIAAYLFDFDWAGLINGGQVSGSGRGTSLLVKEGGKWQLLIEHLGSKSS